jgi:hypothetical protein
MSSLPKTELVTELVGIQTVLPDSQASAAVSHHPTQVWASPSDIYAFPSSELSESG